jgi:hypothetical protein
MDGVRVTEGMDGDALLMVLMDAGGGFSPAEGSLDTAFGHGRVCRGSPFPITSESGEDHAGMAVGDPVLPEELQGGLRQGEGA